MFKYFLLELEHEMLEAEAENRYSKTYMLKCMLKGLGLKIGLKAEKGIIGLGMSIPYHRYTQG